MGRPRKDDTGLASPPSSGPSRPVLKESQQESPTGTKSSADSAKSSPSNKPLGNASAPAETRGASQDAGSPELASAPPQRHALSHLSTNSAGSLAPASTCRTEPFDQSHSGTSSAQTDRSHGSHAPHSKKSSVSVSTADKGSKTTNRKRPRSRSRSPMRKNNRITSLNPKYPRNLDGTQPVRQLERPRRLRS